ncbi:MAG: L-aspartate oxidase, partial [Planctomycetota bacterium]|nr:L-aspartate oxidase [Planctomycetota bacterium]
VITKCAAVDSATNAAQGGIAVGGAPGDSPGLHVKDTLRTGNGLCRRDVVRSIIGGGRDRIAEIAGWGARFDRKGPKLHYAIEGGHSVPRILHSGGDATGGEIQRVLLEQALSVPAIQILENTYAIDLLTLRGVCVGALIFDEQRGRRAVWARCTVLATGGAGQLYRETTNPEVATGNGIAMAYRAGAQLRDLEFMQFHPTTLYVPGAARSLISEAVRGEGGILRDRLGKRFMTDYHPALELAPRDVVSRAIVKQMALTGDTNVYLHLEHIGAARIHKRFPALQRLCEKFEIDVSRNPIPVRPSAHYMIGGVATDVAGRTTVPGLLAAGEVACTGLHGANRLASNSLLECLVVGHNSGKACGPLIARSHPPLPTRLFYEQKKGDTTYIDVEDVMNSLRSLMWRQVGVERDEKGLRDAIMKLEFWCSYVLDKEFSRREGWELQNMLTVARLMASSALRRRESRGVHCRTDFPAHNDRKFARPFLVRRR